MFKLGKDEFLEMVESVGCKTYTREQIEKALQNTMYMVQATVNGKLAGIGRVVGDYSIFKKWNRTWKVLKLDIIK